MRSPCWALGLTLSLALRVVGEAQSAPSIGETASTAALQFAVSTVKPSQSHGWRMEFTPDGFVSQGTTLALLVREAYGAYDGGYVTGGPSWVNWPGGERFDVQARLDPAEIPKFRELSRTQRRAMLQRLLAKRFGLVVHTETKDVKGYELRVAKGGPRAGALSLVTDPQQLGSLPEAGCLLSGRGPGRGDIEAKQCSMENLSSVLCGSIAPKIVNKTGMEGRYDFALRWASEHHGSAAAEEVDPADEQPPLLLAIRQQLGLELDPAQVPITVVVIDEASQPGEN